MFQAIRQRILASTLVALASAAMFPVCAQRLSVDLPDAPVPKQNASAGQQKSKNGLTSTVQLLGRRSLFFPDLARDEAPLTAAQKFELAADESIAPSSILGGAFAAGISQAENSWPGYGQGGEGFAKRFGATMGVNASANMFGGFVLASIGHHDPRYFVSQGGTARKIGHAIRRVLLTRTDSGGETANWSGIFGVIGAEGLANVYLPDAERTASKTFERSGIQFGAIAGGNVAKEFWPMIFKSLLGGGRTARQADLKDSPAKP